MDNHSNDKQEQRAIERHSTYYKIHRFYIRSFEEYLIMEPFMKIFDNVKMILSRKLRDGVLEDMIIRYKKTKPYMFKYNEKRKYYNCSFRY